MNANLVNHFVKRLKLCQIVEEKKAVNSRALRSLGVRQPCFAQILKRRRLNVAHQIESPVTNKTHKHKLALAVRRHSYNATIGVWRVLENLKRSPRVCSRDDVIVVAYVEQKGRPIVYFCQIVERLDCAALRVTADYEAKVFVARQHRVVTRATEHLRDLWNKMAKQWAFEIFNQQSERQTARVSSVSNPHARHRRLPSEHVAAV